MEHRLVALFLGSFLIGIFYGLVISNPIASVLLAVITVFIFYIILYGAPPR